VLRGPGGTIYLSNKTLAAVAEFAIALQDLIHTDPDLEHDPLNEGEPAFDKADVDLADRTTLALAARLPTAEKRMAIEKASTNASPTMLRVCRFLATELTRQRVLSTRVSFSAHITKASADEGAGGPASLGGRDHRTSHPPTAAQGVTTGLSS
jgi:hypothetical protein